MTDWFFAVVIVWALVSTAGWIRADDHRRDAWTDLSVLIHQLELTEDDLHRTRDHGPVQDSLERRRRDSE